EDGDDMSDVDLAPVVGRLVRLDSVRSVFVGACADYPGDTFIRFIGPDGAPLRFRLSADAKQALLHLLVNPDAGQPFREERTKPVLEWKMEVGVVALAPMGMDAMRLCFGIKPRNFTADEVIRWIRALTPEAPIERGERT